MFVFSGIFGYQLEFLIFITDPPLHCHDIINLRLAGPESIILVTTFVLYTLQFVSQYRYLVQLIIVDFVQLLVFIDQHFNILVQFRSFFVFKVQV